jgi:hypothetical protein
MSGTSNARDLISIGTFKAKYRPRSDATKHIERSVDADPAVVITIKTKD